MLITLKQHAHLGVEIFVDALLVIQDVDASFKFILFLHAFNVNVYMCS